ncbi:AlwI family type II restriction endonuclease [Clostridium baratii]|uniref:AlwI family type II restriction endonuclease n=1 Tax=Clostridium baratii TaxID=1561 RepID=UPI001C01DD73|nr:AlwI family type II restriction endonuclease [Clostridium baratii]MBT9832397.1 AlwI family type II restriction endonuclease [Clostridium baratii]
MEMWSLGTALRNPYRIEEFLEVLSHFDGEIWDGNTQLDYYIELIRRGVVNPRNIRRSDLNCNQPEARRIMRNRYEDAPIRGRVLGSLFEKLGIINIINNRINITQIGSNILERNGDFSENLTEALRSWRYINPVSQLNSSIRTTNFNPFIATINVIERVNQIIGEHSGISYQEYILFVKILDCYDLVDYYANLIVDSRRDRRVLQNQIEFVRRNCINDYNENDYSDNEIKYFVATNLLTFNNGILNLNY